MAKHVYINLPVANLTKSIAFFKALGIPFNPEMSDDSGACFVVSDSIYVMATTHSL